MTRCLASCGRQFLALQPLNPSIEEVGIGGLPVVCGRLPVAEPEFDETAPDYADQVLVHVVACSCNYRDRRLMMRVAAWGPPWGFYPFGSEFAGRIVAAGRDVDPDRAPGTAVIGDGSMVAVGASGWRGVPTNHASKELLALPASKVLPIPDSMSMVEGAAFSIGAQTSYAMIRRAGVVAGSKVLVCGGRSNTALFLLAALGAVGCEVYVTTSANSAVERLRRLGARHVFVVGRDAGDWLAVPALGDLVHDVGGLDCVLDPFADANLPRAVRLLAMGGRYVTCGLADQSSDLTGPATSPPVSGIRDSMAAAIMRNATIVGNCLGTTADLERALADYCRGALAPIIDSVHTGSDVGSFVRRTFEDLERFGKVVYCHDEEEAVDVGQP